MSALGPNTDRRMEVVGTSTPLMLCRASANQFVIASNKKLKRAAVYFPPCLYGTNGLAPKGGPIYPTTLSHTSAPAVLRCCGQGRGAVTGVGLGLRGL